ncbi:four helix bundle protein [Granulicella sp. S156]|uniref:four helix bundle protein n=1 Tax=Granulicella sp. S156 TaxID=1747224 RepID=UPI00131D1668|nr:four helix bundle protein [Granulicella sp. S156]
MAKSFRELKVWKLSIDLTVLVYGLTAEFPKSEIYGLSSQMQRAAVSIASNIAEGSARGTRKDFKQFVSIARGSNCELQTQFLIANRLGFAEEHRIGEIEMLSHEVGQMLSGLSKYLSQPPKVRQTEN